MSITLSKAAREWIESNFTKVCVRVVIYIEAICPEFPSLSRFGSWIAASLIASNI